ncbi:MAG TPA: hypothetical protein VGB37_10875 [Candidatus Lokiarchaeia archaeon]
MKRKIYSKNRNQLLGLVSSSSKTKVSHGDLDKRHLYSSPDLSGMHEGKYYNREKENDYKRKNKRIDIEE